MIPVVTPLLPYAPRFLVQSWRPGDWTIVQWSAESVAGGIEAVDRLCASGYEARLLAVVTQEIY